MATEEATAVNDQVVADTTASDSAPEENSKSEVISEADLEKGFDDAAESIEQETEAEEQSDGDETKDEKTESPEVKTPSPEDEWNQLNGKSQDKFREAINERNELRRQNEELKARQAQFATEQDLINEINPETGEYYTPQEIERISWQKGRELQAERVNQEIYQNQVRENQLAINEEALKVQELPVFNPQSKDFNPGLAEQYADLLSDNLVYQLPDGRTANRSTLLANGINPESQATLVGVNTSPLKLAKSLAGAVSGARAQGETVGQAKAQKATARMMANVDSASGVSGATAKPKEDPLMAGFDSY